MKKVMSVGQCPPDHAAIRNFIESVFDAEIVRIDSTEEALEEMKNSNYDLILVNRKLDIDYTDGTILIEKMQSDDRMKNIPVMLITNFEEYMDEAVKLGGVPGFGKTGIGSSMAVANIEKFIPKKGQG